MSEEPKKKKKRRNAMPWDLLNPNTVYVPEDIYSERFDICKSCDRFNKKTGICGECHCFMKLKCAIDFAFCPLGKWDYHDMSNYTPDPDWKPTPWEPPVEEEKF